MQKRAYIKWGLVLTVVVFLLWFNYRYLNIQPSEIREWILKFGVFAPILYVIIYTLRPLILFPASIMSLAGGIAFGTLWGTVLTTIGSIGSAAIAFWISRKLGHNLVTKEWKGKGEKIQKQLESNGFYYFFLLRLIPILNFDMISYMAGVSKVKLRPFILGTTVGIIPGTFVYTFLGASLVAPTWDTILLPIIFFVIIFIAPILFNEKVRNKLGLKNRKKSND